MGRVGWKMMISIYLLDLFCLLSQILLCNQMFSLQLLSTLDLGKMWKNLNKAPWSISPVDEGKQNLWTEWRNKISASLINGYYYHLWCWFQGDSCTGYYAELSKPTKDTMKEVSILFFWAVKHFPFSCNHHFKPEYLVVLVQSTWVFIVLFFDSCVRLRCLSSQHESHSKL